MKLRSDCNNLACAFLFFYFAFSLAGTFGASIICIANAVEVVVDERIKRLFIRSGSG